MTDRRTVQLVLWFLGVAALSLILGGIVLTWRVLDQAGRAGQVDPVAVGTVGAITTLAGTVLGALGAILVSTRSVEEPPAPPPAPEPEPDPVAQAHQDLPATVAEDSRIVAADPT